MSAIFGNVKRNTEHLLRFAGNVVVDTTKVAGAALMAKAASRIAEEYFGAAVPGGEFYDPVAEDMNIFYRETLPEGTYPEEQRLLFEMLTGAALFFAKDLARLPSLKFKDITPKNTALFATRQTEDFVRALATSVGGCYLMKSLRNVSSFTELGAGCKFCSEVKESTARAFLYLPSGKTVKTCVETVAGLGGFFNRLMPSLTSRAHSLEPEKRD